MQRKSIAERFWPKVDKNGPVPPHCPELGPCWIWTGGCAGKGYGVVGIGYRADHNRSQVYVHRLSCEWAYGPIPEGLDACHACDNPPCVRPSHLFIGTRRDNMQDAKSKGRMATGDAVAHRGVENVGAKLSLDDVAEIRRLGAYIPFGRGRNTGNRNAPGHLTQSMLAARFGVTDTVIGNVLRKETYITSKSI